MRLKVAAARMSSLKVVLVRHGQSECNQTKTWSGWCDAMLTQRGMNEASECGKLLKQEGLQFDCAFTSSLTRSIKSLNLMMDELDCHYLPVVKSWQLNEKFYGYLQEKAKLSVVEQYGELMVSEWRRSYTIAPPKIFYDDPRHPIHDPRYRKVDPRLLPNTEHMGDVLSRVGDLFESQIKPKLLDRKRLLIVCHGSTVRVMANILLGMPESQSKKFKVPNSTPLVIDLGEGLKVNSWKILGDRAQIAQKMKRVDHELQKED